MSDNPLIAKADEMVGLAWTLREERAAVRARRERLLSDLQKLKAELDRMRRAAQAQRLTAHRLLAERLQQSSGA
jgi:hypothetical protein